MSNEPNISQDDVQNVAALARIHLKSEEAKSLTHDLQGILGYINQLKKLDITGIEPTSHVLPIKNVYREDKVFPLLTQEEALQLAPEKKGSFFKVPKVLE